MQSTTQLSAKSDLTLGKLKNYFEEILKSSKSNINPSTFNKSEEVDDHILKYSDDLVLKDNWDIEINLAKNVKVSLIALLVETDIGREVLIKHPDVLEAIPYEWFLKPTNMLLNTHSNIPLETLFETRAGLSIFLNSPYLLSHTPPAKFMNYVDSKQKTFLYNLYDEGDSIQCLIAHPEWIDALEPSSLTPETIGQILSKYGLQSLLSLPTLVEKIIQFGLEKEIKIGDEVKRIGSVFANTACGRIVTRAYPDIFANLTYEDKNVYNELNQKDEEAGQGISFGMFIAEILQLSVALNKHIPKGIIQWANPEWNKKPLFEVLLHIEKDSYEYYGARIIRELGWALIASPKFYHAMPSQVWEVTKGGISNFRIFLQNEKITPEILNTHPNFLNVLTPRLISEAPPSKVNLLAFFCMDDRWLSRLKNLTHLFEDLPQSVLNQEGSLNGHWVSAGGLLLNYFEGIELLSSNISLFYKLDYQSLFSMGKINSAEYFKQADAVTSSMISFPLLTNTFTGRALLRKHSYNVGQILSNNGIATRSFINKLPLADKDFILKVTLLPEPVEDAQLQSIFKSILYGTLHHGDSAASEQSTARVPRKTKKKVTPQNDAALKAYVQTLFSSTVEVNVKKDGESVELILDGSRIILAQLANLFASKYKDIKLSDSKSWPKQAEKVSLHFYGRVDQIRKAFESSFSTIKDIINPKAVTKYTQLHNLLINELSSRNIKFTLADESSASLSRRPAAKLADGDEKKKLTILGKTGQISDAAQFLKDMKLRLFDFSGVQRVSGTSSKIEFTQSVKVLIDIFSNNKLLLVLDGVKLNGGYISHILLNESLERVSLDKDEQDNWVKAILPVFGYAKNISKLFSFSHDEKGYSQLTVTLPEVGFVLEGIRGPNKNQKDLDCHLTLRSINEIASRINNYFSTNNKEASCTVNEKEMTVTIRPKTKKPMALIKVWEDIFGTLKEDSEPRPKAVKESTNPIPPKPVNKNPADVEAIVVVPLPLNIPEEIRQLFKTIGSDVTEYFDFLTILPRNKEQSKWELSYQTKSVQALGTQKLLPLDLLKYIQTAIASHLDYLRKENLIATPAVEDQEFLRLATTSDPIKYIINFKACGLERIKTEAGKIKEEFNKLIPKPADEFSLSVMPAEQAVLTLPRVPSPPTVKPEPIEVVPNEMVEMERFLRDVLIKATRDKHKFRNIVFHLNKLGKIPAPSAVPHKHDTVYANNYELHMIRLCETLAKTAGPDNVFSKLRNHIRHLRNLPWFEFYQSVQSLVAVLSTFINVKQHKASIKTAFFSYVPQEINQDADALKKLTEQLVEYDHRAIMESKQVTPEIELQETYDKDLARIDAIDDLDPEWLQTAKIAINSKKGELKRNKKKGVGDIYRIIGHEQLEKYYPDLEKDLVARFSYLEADCSQRIGLSNP